MNSVKAEKIVEAWEKTTRIRFKDDKGIERSLFIKKWQSDALRAAGRSPTSLVQERYEELVKTESHLTLKQIRRRIADSIERDAAASISLDGLIL